eukprot:209446-Hanusia_phi.AAC.1
MRFNQGIARRNLLSLEETELGRGPRKTCPISHPVTRVTLRDRSPEERFRGRGGPGTARPTPVRGRAGAGTAVTVPRRAVP